MLAYGSNVLFYNQQESNCRDDVLPKVSAYVLKHCTVLFLLPSLILIHQTEALWGYLLHIRYTIPGHLGALTMIPILLKAGVCGNVIKSELVNDLKTRREGWFYLCGAQEMCSRMSYI